MMMIIIIIGLILILEKILLFMLETNHTLSVNHFLLRLCCLFAVKIKTAVMLQGLGAKMEGRIIHERLKYYSRDLNSEGTLHVLLVSTSQAYLEQLANSISIAREVQKEKRSYNLKVHTCKCILDVLEFMPNEFYIDYVVFILNTISGNCLFEVENNLALLDSSFTREKICLVNPDFSYSRATVSPHEIWDFAKLHQFNIINGKTKDQNGSFTIAKRVLNLAEACCGVLNGIPMINIV